MAVFATEVHKCRAFRVFRDAFLRNWSDVDGGDIFNLHFVGALFDMQTKFLEAMALPKSWPSRSPELTNNFSLDRKFSADFR